MISLIFVTRASDMKATLENADLQSLRLINRLHSCDCRTDWRTSLTGREFLENFLLHIGIPNKSCSWQSQLSPSERWVSVDVCWGRPTHMYCNKSPYPLSQALTLSFTSSNFHTPNKSQCVASVTPLLLLFHLQEPNLSPELYLCPQSSPPSPSKQHCVAFASWSSTDSCHHATLAKFALGESSWQMTFDRFVTLFLN